MQPPPSLSPRLLSTWERGIEFDRQPVRRALLLLEVACPQLSADERERMPLGRRDARLLALREQVFGPTLVSVVPCPGCGEQQELLFNTDDVRAPVPGGNNNNGFEPLSLETQGYIITYRLPSSRDILAVADSLVEQAETDFAEVERALLGRCLLQATHDGAEIACDALPPSVLAALETRISEDDPQADVQLALECAECGHRWYALLDIASFMWNEIASWAKRMLREIHVLARAYGWFEADIVSMHPARRDFYLQLLGE